MSWLDVLSGLPACVAKWTERGGDHQIPERALDLNALTHSGIRLVGRVGAIADGVAHFAGALANVCALADLKMNRLLRRFDAWAAAAGIDDAVDPPCHFEPTAVAADPTLRLDLTSGEIASVIWATGYRPDYSWLDLSVLDRTGRVRHDGGVITSAPGMYLLGAPLLRRRSSTYISGAAADSQDLSERLHAHLDSHAAVAACH